MWSSVLALALLTALDPVRLGVTLLIISRPRALPNLLSYYLGGMVVSVPALLIPLLVLHFTPVFSAFTQATTSTETNTTVRQIQIGVGTVALSIAVLMVIRFSLRQRTRPAPAADPASTLVLDTPKSSPFSRLLDRARNTAAQDRSAVLRLLSRAHHAWENGSPWVAVVIGIGTGPQPFLVLFVLTTIAASGASIGVQVSAALAFVVGVLVIVEIILVGYLVTPLKTQAMMRPLHNWALAHRQAILVTIVATAGLSLVANGITGA